METLLAFIQNNSQSAHLIILGCCLLAGLNIPISIDILMIIAASLAILLPGSFYKLFFAMLIGCLLSAWVAYWLGRIVGGALTSLPFFSRFITTAKLEKIKNFYEKRGLLALILGRFIPFGFRNVLFVSAGLSKTSFRKFVVWDLVACTLWTVSSFSFFYLLGKNLSTLLLAYAKYKNFMFLFALSVTGITFFWYKKRKNVKEENV